MQVGKASGGFGPHEVELETGRRGPMPMAQSGDQVAVLQCSDPNVPSEIRIGFVKKTYGLVLYMLLITFGIASPFIFATEDTARFFARHSSLGAACAFVFVGLYVMNFMLMFAVMCDCRNYLRMYLAMFTKWPQNVVFLTVVSAAFGVLVGWICSMYTVASVLFVFLASAVIVAGLTIYAVYTAADFSDKGGYVLAALLGLILTGFLASFIPGLTGLYTGLGAMLFGFIIVYDTQLIFGRATPFGERNRAFEYTIDMYAFAAYNLYLDYVNLFLYLLQFVGERR